MSNRSSRPLDGPGGISSYYDAVTALPAQVRAQLPLVQQLQVDASNARYYAARLRGDLLPLGDLIVRVQRLQAEEKAFTELEQKLSQNPTDPTPLFTYIQQHQTILRSILPDTAQIARLHSAATAASSDAAGLQQSLLNMNRDTAALNNAECGDLEPPRSAVAEPGDRSVQSRARWIDRQSRFVRGPPARPRPAAGGEREDLGRRLRAP